MSEEKENLSEEELLNRSKIRDDYSDPNRPIRLIVSGSRSIEQYSEFRQKLLQILEQLGPDQVEIVCGKNARGVDDMCYHFVRWDIPHAHVLFEADWDRFDKKAGPYRNESMAVYASRASRFGELFVLWDGDSRGTKSMVNVARRYKLDSRVVISEPWTREHFYALY